MNLKDFSSSVDTKKLQDILRHEFGFNLEASKLSESKVAELKESADSKISAFRRHKSFYESQKNPAYLALLMARQLLENFEFDPELDETDDAHKVLTGFGFQKGNTIAQSPTNRLTVYHGKGPLGANQQVAVTPKTFTHVSHPATPNAIVHAKMEPIENLRDHMLKHWTDSIVNGVKEGREDWGLCWSEKRDGQVVYREKKFFTEAARANFIHTVSLKKSFIKLEAVSNSDGRILTEAGLGQVAGAVGRGVAAAAPRVGGALVGMGGDTIRGLARAGSMIGHGAASIASAGLYGLRGKPLPPGHPGYWDKEKKNDLDALMRSPALRGQKPTNLISLMNQIYQQLDTLPPTAAEAVSQSLQTYYKQRIAQQAPAQAPTPAPQPAVQASPNNQFSNDVYSALRNEGYKDSQTRNIIAQTAAKHPELKNNFDGFIRAALSGK